MTALFFRPSSRKSSKRSNLEKGPKRRSTNSLKHRKGKTRKKKTSARSKWFLCSICRMKNTRNKTRRCRRCHAAYEMQRLAKQTPKQRADRLKRARENYARRMTPELRKVIRERAKIYSARWRKKNPLTKAQREERALYCREWRRRTGWKATREKRLRDGIQRKIRYAEDKAFARRCRAADRKRYHRRKSDPKFKMARAQYARRWKSNPKNRILLNLRRRLCLAVNGVAKSDSTMRLVGCSPKKLHAHLEKQFRPGMNWNNYGRSGWTVDHIRPCALFDLTNPREQRRCFSFKNLQPLWASENSSKKHRMPLLGGPKK